ncbi:hypothetical protein [Rhodanobacter sp. C06]|uniref:hypothetical protein n=1 Tax=Rhodanobacter sp. C06 TaxID=1945854 RepID=UPI001115829B|nr:hypothetical protein [Rhodanobacter sp. C06]
MDTLKGEISLRTFAGNHKREINGCAICQMSDAIDSSHEACAFESFGIEVLDRHVWSNVTRGVHIVGKRGLHVRLDGTRQIAAIGAGIAESLSQGSEVTIALLGNGFVSKLLKR